MECGIAFNYLCNLILKIIVEVNYKIEPHGYRKRKDLFIFYKGLQVLCKKKFGIYINLTFVQEIILNKFPVGLTQDSIVHFLRTGVTISNFDFWKVFREKREIK